MLQPNALIHIVGNLESSVRFYRDAVGFELMGDPVALTSSTLLQHVQARAGDAAARVARFRIPGSEMTLQLIEFSNVAGHRFEQRLYDPGVTRFSIQVRDIDAAFASVVNERIVVDTTGGAPVYTQRPRNDIRAVMMRDPDGFVFEFVGPSVIPDTDVRASSNIFNARSSLALDDMDRSVEFYRDLLGYGIPGEPNTVNDAVLALEGTPDAVARTLRSQPPGSTNVWFLWEFSEIERTKRSPSPEDPGASAISLLVANLPDLVARMKAAGVKVETPGGEPVDFADGARGVLVRSPDGLLVELLELGV
jgi:catechol 2,3-dioxygenase-like lactoylglutathione lyase family enzyme